MPRWTWPAAILVSLAGAWLLYDANPGLNWVIWVTAAAAGLAGVVHHRHGAAGRPAYLLLVLAVAVVAGTPATADGPTHFGIVVLTGLLLACATLLAVAPDMRAIQPLFIVRAPFRALRGAIPHALRQSTAASKSVTSPRARPVVRGTLIAVPCIVVLGLLLSAADPTMAAWRDAIATLIPSSEIIDRTLFFIVFLIITLGAYSYAALEAVPRTPSPDVRALRLGPTELHIICASVAALLYLFIALQLSYLFSNAPLATGTGVTYAEYARRGFAELVIAAGIVVAIVILAEHSMSEMSVIRLIRWLEYALLVAIVVLLASALFRIDLYESAYGYTVRRLYARVAAGLLFCAVTLLGVQLVRGFDVGRLSRQVITIAIVTFIALTWWNEDAWIAHRNLARLAVPSAKQSVPLDVAYLTQLSDDAAPTLVAALPTLPQPVRDSLTRTLGKELFWRLRDARPDPWYAWNVRRAHARVALRQIPIYKPN